MEVWKKINNLPYEVSNYGNVRNLSGKILKPAVKRGYLTVNLYCNGQKQSKLIHRLVGETFIPNPDNLSQINHKNEIKSDNRVENLEWCDSKYNNNYGTRNERLSTSKVGKNNPMYGKCWSESQREKLMKTRIGHRPYNNKPVVQLTTDNQVVNIFDSALKAAEYFGKYNSRSNITKACKHNCMALGYKWVYKDNTINTDKQDDKGL